MMTPVGLNTYAEGREERRGKNRLTILIVFILPTLEFLNAIVHLQRTGGEALQAPIDPRAPISRSPYVT